MKIVTIISLTLLTVTLSGLVDIKPSSNTGILNPEALKQNLIDSKNQIDEIIAPWQKEKLASVRDKLSKTRLSASSANNPVDLIKTEVKRVFYRLTDMQTDFFTAYVLGSLFSTGSQVPDWIQNALQKEQQLIQMLSNVSKMINDTGHSTIRKIGCSGSECDD